MQHILQANNVRSVRKSAIMGIMTVFFFREIITIHEGNLVLDQAHSIIFHAGTGLSLKASQPCFGCFFLRLKAWDPQQFLRLRRHRHTLWQGRWLPVPLTHACLGPIAKLATEKNETS